MNIERGGYLNYVKPARAANKETIALFLQNKVLLSVKTRHDRYKFRVKLFGKS